MVKTKVAFNDLAGRQQAALNDIGRLCRELRKLDSQIEQASWGERGVLSERREQLLFEVKNQPAVVGEIAYQRAKVQIQAMAEEIKPPMVVLEHWRILYDKYHSASKEAARRITDETYEVHNKVAHALEEESLLASGTSYGHLGRHFTSLDPQYRKEVARRIREEDERLQVEILGEEPPDLLEVEGEVSQLQRAAGELYGENLVLADPDTWEQAASTYARVILERAGRLLTAHLSGALG